MLEAQKRFNHFYYIFFLRKIFIFIPIPLLTFLFFTLSIKKLPLALADITSIKFYTFMAQSQGSLHFTP